MDTTVLVLIIVVVVLLVAVAALGTMFVRRRRSDQLREQFGPEYERRLSETGDRKAAESDLRARQSRRKELDIRDLDAGERARYQQSWESIQRDFVDDPARALDDAEKLVVEVMRVRGYPTDDADRRTEDLSVDHPDIVRHYRAARAVQRSTTDGGTDTERQRRALTSYRTLVEELLRPGKADTDDRAPTESAAANGTETSSTPTDRTAPGRTALNRHEKTGQETAR